MSLLMAKSAYLATIRLQMSSKLADVTSLRVYVAEPNTTPIGQVKRIQTE